MKITRLSVCHVDLPPEHPDWLSAGRFKFEVADASLMKIEAVLEQLPGGKTFFANDTKGVELAEAIVNAVPCCEQVRLSPRGARRICTPSASPVPIPGATGS